MNVYLASRYEEKEKLRLYRERLIQSGLKCTANWLDEPESDNGMAGRTDEKLNILAKKDWLDVLKSNVFVLFTHNPTPRGGRHVEFGMAYAMNKQLIICGPRENIFHYMHGVKQFDTFEKVLDYLESCNVAI